MSAAGRGHWETLMARDGHEFAAWLAPPTGNPRGAVVILQEIFGVNAHIRSVVERYAAEGFVAIAPALFDRIERHVELGYLPPEVERARGYMLQLDEAKTMLDVSAAVNVVRHAGRVALIGYCWGGQVAWLGAGQLPVNAAVGYYASRLWQKLEQLPKRPMLFHFGERDAGIPLEQVEKVRAAYPQGTYHFYPADHGFNCDARSQYDAACAQLAWQRTQDFLREHVG
jgi:carboxymethylenebutenolidase